MAPAPRWGSCRTRPACYARSAMEALVIIIPPIIALLIGAWAVMAPRQIDVAAEQKVLDEHIAWLEERLAHARAGNWDEQMMANLHAQMAEARRKQQALVAA